MQERCRAEHRGASWHLRSKRRQSLAQCCLTAIDDLLGLGLLLLVLRPKICRLKRLQRLPPGPLHHADYWSPITDHYSLARPRPSCGPPPCWPRGHPSPPKAFGADTGGCVEALFAPYSPQAGALLAVLELFICWWTQRRGCASASFLDVL